mmetsp:Transcript_13391/g.35145  ORF Transcript_13391/g.35145 Transcript_13391/m.35145 type:complete len:165 (+) Transcript_13391:457-951(+)
MSKRVYVGNLSWKTRWQGLKDHMRSAGEVAYAEVLFDGNYSKGCGIVEFTEESAVTKAIETLHDSELDGRKIFVREDRRDPEASKKQVYVGNLPFHVSWQDLKDTFRKAGNVVRADVQMGQDGRSKGYGTVLFESGEDAENAIKMFNGADFDGRTIAVHLDKRA